MEDFSKIAKELKKNIKKMTKMNESILNEIREQSPEQVNQILKDNKLVMKAIKNRDIDALNNLHSRYADNSNK